MKTELLEADAIELENEPDSVELEIDADARELEIDADPVELEIDADPVELDIDADVVGLEIAANSVELVDADSAGLALNAVDNTGLGREGALHILQVEHFPLAPGQVREVAGVQLLWYGKCLQTSGETEGDATLVEDVTDLETILLLLKDSDSEAEAEFMLETTVLLEMILELDDETTTAREETLTVAEVADPDTEAPLEETPPEPGHTFRKALSKVAVSELAVEVFQTTEDDDNVAEFEAVDNVATLDDIAIVDDFEGVADSEVVGNFVVVDDFEAVDDCEGVTDLEIVEDFEGVTDFETLENFEAVDDFATEEDFAMEEDELRVEDCPAFVEEVIVSHLP
ncbi:hypothetical protein T440DRAFT_518422 [Plenodomus tracheiphilus IPT5]|uniref:Uncharacterized protein n=1 Tax=Plenodomus tracheiphilus IPT5 TaxID=1408161 RepID=A0A6A7B462_9PLEO|nr:hypothetical protein T440DRAFT_518422 [Plenodomus tracheiphilus IPT5]